MARASKDDLEVALAVTRIIEDLEKGYMPEDKDQDELVFFDRDDNDQCREALNAILEAASKGSLFRVTFGMTVVLDPRNKVVDPDADTLELHPEHLANATDAERYRWLRDLATAQDLRYPLMGKPDEIDSTIDAARAQQGKESQ